MAATNRTAVRTSFRGPLKVTTCPSYDAASGLVVRAEPRGPPADHGPLEGCPASRAPRPRPPAHVREPSSLRRDVVVASNRLSNDQPEPSEESLPILGAKRLHPAPGVDARLPQDLVGQQVPHAGDEPLIHEHRLHRPAPPREPVQEGPPG